MTSSDPSQPGEHEPVVDPTADTIEHVAPAPGEPTGESVGAESAAAGSSSVDPAPALPIVARAAGYYRLTRYIMVAGICFMGLWFARDGWANWPAQEAAYERGLLHHERVDPKMHHTEFEIELQKTLGFGLPVLSLFILVWSLYRSRGAYVLDEAGLHLPGHPLIPLDRMTALDSSRWETKRIARVIYTGADGKEAAGTLDDFVYQERPTVAIYQLLKQHVDAGAAPSETAAPEAVEPRQDAQQV